MSGFVPGLTVAGDFFAEVVRPILTTHFPALEYGAALIGPGSEVLGFDTPMSMDHDWGFSPAVAVGYLADDIPGE